MPRPRKHRRLGRQPGAGVYKPAGVPLDELSQVALQADELEALRLADLNGLSQEEAAAQMQVSRSTFQRILEHARRQVALALVERQALRIERNEADPDGGTSDGQRRPEQIAG